MTKDTAQGTAALETMTEVVERQKVELEISMATAIEASKVLSPGSQEFDEVYGRYLRAKADLARIPIRLVEAKLQDNAGAIATAGAAVGEAITNLLVGLKVEDLLITPVMFLTYGVVEGKVIVRFNPITTLAPSHKGEGVGRGRGRGGKRPHIISSDGTELTITEFVTPYLTTEEKDPKSSKYVKWPHVCVDSLEKFGTFCKAHQIADGTYTYKARVVAQTPETKGPYILPDGTYTNKAPATTVAAQTPETTGVTK